MIAAPRASGAALTTAAPFSSWGLAFDGGIKPDLLAPGVGLATAEPGAAPDGGSVFGTVSGSSAAAAVVAGAAALLAEARPDAERGEASSAARRRGEAARPGSWRPPRGRACSTSAARPRWSSSPTRPSSPSAAGRSRAGAGTRCPAPQRLGPQAHGLRRPGRRRTRHSACRIKPRRTEIEPGARRGIAVRTPPITIAAARRPRAR